MKTLIVSALALFATATLAQAQTQYVVPQWPQGLKTVPCDAFKKTPDGGWAQNGRLIAGKNRTIISENKFGQGGGEWQLIEDHCGEKK